MVRIGGLAVENNPVKKFILLLLFITLLSFLPIVVHCSTPPHSVKLMWFLSADNDAVYQNVWMSKGCNGVWFWRARLSPTDTEWVDYRVASGKTYCYEVTVHDSVLRKNSPPSNIVEVTIP